MTLDRSVLNLPQLRLPSAAALTLGLLVGCSGVADSAPDGASTATSAGSTASATDGNTSDTGGLTSAGSDGGTDGSGTGGESTGGGTGGTGGDPPPDEDPNAGTTGETTGGVTCDDQTPVELFISPDDSNSMSSPIQVRETVLNGWGSLAAIPIRTFEFFNYYRFAYPGADPGTVKIDTSLHQDPNDPAGEYLLQVGISSEVIANATRPPISVTLVLDTSGSMLGDPLDRMKDVCRAIAASLKEGDKVSMVTWSTNQVPILAGFQVSGPNDPTLLSKIEALDASGGTDLHAGLEAGYGLANQIWEKDRINRLVLVSDGGANAGITEIDIIAQHAAMNGGDGVYLVGVGVGSPNTYKDQMMDEVTDAGKGASAFIASEDEAWRLFNQRFVNTMMVAARDVEIRLDLPPGFEIVEFSGEDFSADPTEIDPQHLAPNDAMVFHQRIRTCAPEIIDDAAEITVTAMYRDAISLAANEATQTVTFGELLYANEPLLHKGAAIFAYTEALKAYKRAGTLAEKKDIVADALAKIDAAKEFLPRDPDLAEITLVLEGL